MARRLKRRIEKDIAYERAVFWHGEYYFDGEEGKVLNDEQVADKVFKYCGKSKNIWRLLDFFSRRGIKKLASTKPSSCPVFSSIGKKRR